MVSMGLRAHVHDPLRYRYDGLYRVTDVIIPFLSAPD